MIKLKELDKLGDFTLEKTFKRREGEWHTRYVWTLGEKESPWFGYETAEEAIKALLRVG